MRLARPAVAAIFAALLGCGSGKHLASIAVEPAPATVAAGYVRQLTARGSYSDGTTEDLTAAVTWSSSDAQTATVSATGLVAAHRLGSVEITATAGDVSANGALLVQGPPDANDSVNAIAVGPDGTVYLGGDFTYVGPTTGALVPFDLASGHTALVPVPKFEGSISVLLPDGRGGRYVGGQFTVFGPHTQKRYLAHLEADGTLDPDFSPNPGGIVDGLVRHGDTLIASGSFSSIGGRSAFKLATIDAVTGNLIQSYPSAFFPYWGTNDRVDALALNGDFLSIAGHLSDGIAWRSLATVDLNTGAVRWYQTNGPVFALASSDRTLYAAGQFSDVGGVPRRNLAAIDVPTGTVTNWDPSADGPVASIAVSGGYAYVAGNFELLRGAYSPRFAQLDLPSGSVTPWSPRLEMWVDALTANGDAAYLAGTPTITDCPARQHLLKIAAASGEVTTWSLGANGPVLALNAEAGTLFAGGAFTGFGGVCRRGLASIDAAGSVTQWSPDTNGSVMALQVSGSALYVGGYFTTIGGKTRHRLAAFDASGELTAWDPGASDLVASLALGEGGTIYAAGLFRSVGTHARSYLAAIDPAGAVTPWNPGADDIVVALAVKGDTVFAGGLFSALGGQPRSYLGAVSASSGTVTNWNPAVCSNGTGNYCGVYALALGTGGRLYVGGRFYALDGQPREIVAAFEASGRLSEWTQHALSGGNAYALAAGGGRLYVGGYFYRDGGPSLQSGLAALDEVSGESTGWNPDVIGPGYAMATAPDGSAFWGGKVGELSTNRNSCFGRVPPAPQP